VKLLLLALVALAGCSWETAPPIPDKEGTREITTTFVWMPMECPDGKTYWLTRMRVDRLWEVPTPFSGLRAYDSCIGKAK
jgi:hypothetical protein